MKHTDEIDRLVGDLNFFLRKKKQDEAFEVLKKIKITWINKDGDTPLLLACIHNNIEIMKYCIEHGAQINVHDKNKSYALHYACENGNFELIKLLIQNGAEINVKNKYSATPLARTIWDHRNRLDIIEFLLKKGANAFVFEDYTKDDPRVETHNAYEFAKNDIKSDEIVALIEKYDKK